MRQHCRSSQQEYWQIEAVEMTHLLPENCPNHANEMLSIIL